MGILKGNAIVGQSGGPTAAINATLSGVIRGAIADQNIGTIYGAYNGVEGMLADTYCNLSEIFADESKLKTLETTPAAALGSCVSIPVSKRDPELPTDEDMDELSKKIWQLLGNGETGFDEMQAALETETGALLAALMKLELKMFIELTPEQRYRRMV